MKMTRRTLLTAAVMLACFPVTGSTVYAQRDARPSRSNAEGQRGVIYQARDLRTGKVYVGEAASGTHLKEREKSYVERGNRGTAYEFRVIEEPRRGELRVREEHHLRAATAEYGRDMVENKISAMRAEKYEAALRERARETTFERRARLEKAEQRFERGRQATERRERRLERGREAARRLERQRQEQERRRESERRGAM